MNAVFSTWLRFQGCSSALTQRIRLAHWGDGSQPGGTSVQVGFPWGAPLGARFGRVSSPPSLPEELLSEPLVPGLETALGCDPHLSARPAFHPALKSLDLCPFPATLSGVTN